MSHRGSRTRDRRSVTRRGFTLLEVIVVVTIIALLATLVAPRLLGNIDKAKQSKAQSEVNSIHQQVSIWLANNGRTTVSDDFELEMLTEGPDAVLDSEDLVDPWENPYRFAIDGSDFVIFSLGRDGQEGGEGYDGDIESR